MIVEDGSGIADANSYCDSAFLKQYFSDRGVPVPSDDEIETLLVNATDFIEQNFVFRGVSNPDRILQLPTSSIDNIPTLVKMACCDVARYVVGGGVLNEDDVGIKQYSVKVGPISKSVQYDPSKIELRGVLLGRLKRILSPVIDQNGNYFGSNGRAYR